VSEWDLAQITGFPASEIAVMLRRLQALGAVDFAGETLPPRAARSSNNDVRIAGRERMLSIPDAQPTGRERIPSHAETLRAGRERMPSNPETQPAGRERMPSHPEMQPTGRERVASNPLSQPPPNSSSPHPPSIVHRALPIAPDYDPAVLDEDVEIDRDRRKRILDTFHRLDVLSYYELLGVSRGADKKQIKNAYYEIAPEYHPDKFFRKRLGSYKTKIEAIFARLTVAHDVLSSKQRRAEYDQELDSIPTARAPLDTLPSIDVPPPPPEPTRIIAAPGPAPKPRTTSGVMPVVREEPPITTPSGAAASGPESVKSRRNTLARKLTGGAMPRVDAPPSAPLADKSTSQQDSAEALRRSYEAARVQAHKSEVERYLEVGRSALERGDLAAAAHAYRYAASLAPDDAGVQAACARALRQIAAAQADDNLRIAQREERLGRWAEAALAYAKVCAGRPEDALVHERAAAAAIAAALNPRRAVEYARRAVELEPRRAELRVTLARAYAAAGLDKSAHGEIERALELAPHDPKIRALAVEMRERAELRGKVS